jgi:hypothetical protein
MCISKDEQSRLIEDAADKMIFSNDATLELIGRLNDRVHFTRQGRLGIGECIDDIAKAHVADDKQVDITRASATHLGERPKDERDVDAIQ